MVGNVAIMLLRIRIIDCGFLSNLGTVFFCYVFCSEVRNAFKLAVISSSRRVTSESQSSKMVIALMRSLSTGWSRASLSARYVDMLISNFERSAIESRQEGVPMRRLFPCMTLLANVENDSCEVI